MPGEPLDALQTRLPSSAGASPRIRTGASATGHSAGAAPGAPVAEQPATAAYDRLARVLAEALAAWWRRTYPDDPDLAR